MAYYTNHRLEIQQLVPNSIKSLLDIGCGEGIFANDIKIKHGCEVWGVEPVTAAADAATKCLDKVFCGFFDKEMAEKINRTFDVICFNDVLEHLVDPWSALMMCEKLLTPKGVIIASMPNILHYQEFLDIVKKKDFKYEQEGIMDKTHLRFFTKKSMQRMFAESGYKVKDIIGLDPTPSKLMKLISIFSGGYLSEMKYPQFAVIAEKQ